MEFRPLTLDDRKEWARLLAVSFHRTQEQMEQLLVWFHEGFPLVTWGAWDGDRLVAQYNCRLLTMHVPGVSGPALAGMGLNMAVDPDYRGRGLLDAVATPVHKMITERGCIAGVGFSSVGGLAVTRSSKSYRYEVLGPMASIVTMVTHRRYPTPLDVTAEWPEGTLDTAPRDEEFISYAVTTDSLRHRFADHPFRHYSFASWHEGARLRGLVIYRVTSLRGIHGAALLGAYGDDLNGLLGRWAATCRARGLHAVHALTSPASPFRDALRVIGTRVTVPFSRDPYHLIVRPLRDDAPAVLADLGRWDCTGGDIL